MKKVSEIVQLGDAILRLNAQRVVDVNSKSILLLIEHMLEILSESNGVGLAAPQIAGSFRIIIVASRPSKRYPHAPEMEPVVMINPEFEVISQLMEKDWEGCLSIPGIRAMVPRYKKIKINYSDQLGESQELIADGFIARIFQHEYDHLNGLVYLDRVETNRDIISESEFHKLMESE